VQKQESALATLEQTTHKRGKPFCRNHMREGHSTKECRGIGVSKDKQKQKSFKKSTGKKKGRERTHNITDGGGGDSGSKDEDSHLVKFKKCLTTNITNFSYYSQFDGNSLSSPINSKV
jgi:hypothetical protein